jgi:hypothetical protein
MQAKIGTGAIIVTAFVLCVGGVVSSAALPGRALASPRTPVPPAPPTDACALLTQDQVKAALGVPVGAGQHIMANHPTMCGWEVPGEKSMNRKRLMVSIYGQMGHMTPADRFNNVKKPFEGIKKEPVSGVGDDAVSVTTPGFGTGLIFKKGASVIDVRVYGFPDAELKAKEKTLALDVIAKL